MTRAVAALLAVLACSGAAEADDFSAWREGAAAAAIEGDPWLAGAGFVAEDAFVFADVPRNPTLDAATVAVAVRTDMERMTRPVDVARPRGEPARSGRVAAAFDRFAPLGVDGRAYASLEIAGGRAGPATTVREVALVPAVLAMSLPIR